MPITVVIADDREFLRKAIRSLLDLDGDIKIVGEAENFPQTIALMRELNPHVVVMDLHMDAPDDFSPNASYSCDQPMSRTVPRIPRPPPVPHLE